MLIVICFGFNRWDVTDRAKQLAVVEFIHPLQPRQLDLLQAAGALALVTLTLLCRTQRRNIWAMQLILPAIDSIAADGEPYSP